MNVPQPTLLGRSYAAMGKMEFLTGPFYYYCLVLLALGVLVMWGIVRSPYGLHLQAARDKYCGPYPVPRTHGANAFGQHGTLGFVQHSRLIAHVAGEGRRLEGDGRERVQCQPQAKQPGREAAPRSKLTISFPAPHFRSLDVSAPRRAARISRR